MGCRGALTRRAGLVLLWFWMRPLGHPIPCAVSRNWSGRERCSPGSCPKLPACPCCEIFPGWQAGRQVLPEVLWLWPALAPRWPRCWPVLAIGSAPATARAAANALRIRLNNLSQKCAGAWQSERSGTDCDHPVVYWLLVRPRPGHRWVRSRGGSGDPLLCHRIHLPPSCLKRLFIDLVSPCSPR